LPSVRATPPISCRKQDMTRYDAVNYINHGIAKSGGDAPR
jgi:hypothetical protein